jgi:hypothetical protein
MSIGPATKRPGQRERPFMYARISNPGCHRANIQPCFNRRKDPTGIERPNANNRLQPFFLLSHQSSHQKFPDVMTSSLEPPLEVPSACTLELLSVASEWSLLLDSVDSSLHSTLHASDSCSQNRGENERATVSERNPRISRRA